MLQRAKPEIILLPLLVILILSACTPDIPETIIALAIAGVSTNAEWTPYTQKIDGVQMALVPAGCFQMGSADGENNEQPVHEVCFEEPFWIDVYEVTNQQYGSIGKNGRSENCKLFSSEPDQPRNCVYWVDAAAHCESRKARIPTEAEWEYAARGPDGLIYPWGDKFVAENVPYSEDIDVQNLGPDTAGLFNLAEVGSYPGGMSWVGAYDLSGNIWEWVNDRYDEDYYSTLSDGVVNPQGPGSGESRVLRGGSWWLTGPNGLRAAYRGTYFPGSHGFFIGFRCARSYEP